MSTKRPLFCRHTKHGLQPSDRATADALAQIPPCEIVRVEIKRPRNIRHHRLYWGMLQKICDNLDNVRPEILNDVIKLRTGHVQVLKTRQGIVEIPGSISFDKMDQNEFRDFYERAVGFICTDIIPGLNAADLQRELIEMMGG